jgi:transposase
VNSMHYVGLDVHKKTISYCLRQADGTIVQEGTIPSTRQALAGLLEGFPQPWVAGLEATMFSAWIYDHIRAQGGSVKVAHSMMLKAIAAGKRKNDRVDARKIADLLHAGGAERPDAGVASGTVAIEPNHDRDADPNGPPAIESAGA